MDFRNRSRTLTRVRHHPLTAQPPIGSDSLDLLPPQADELCLDLTELLKRERVGLGVDVAQKLHWRMVEGPGPGPG